MFIDIIISLVISGIEWSAYKRDYNQNDIDCLKVNYKNNFIIQGTEKIRLKISNIAFWFIKNIKFQSWISFIHLSHCLIASVEN